MGGLIGVAPCAVDEVKDTIDLGGGKKRGLTQDVNPPHQLPRPCCTHMQTLAVARLCYLNILRPRVRTKTGLFACWPIRRLFVCTQCES